MKEQEQENEITKGKNTAFIVVDNVSSSCFIQVENHFFISSPDKIIISPIFELVGVEIYLDDNEVEREAEFLFRDGRKIRFNFEKRVEEFIKDFREATKYKKSIEYRFKSLWTPTYEPQMIIITNEDISKNFGKFFKEKYGKVGGFSIIDVLKWEFVDMGERYYCVVGGWRIPINEYKFIGEQHSNTKSFREILDMVKLNDWRNIKFK